MNSLHQHLAERLREAAATRTAVLPIADELDEKSVEAAYAIQKINTDYAMTLGRRRAGCKIGLTSTAVQRQLGVDQPDFGVLFADMAYADGQEVDAAALLQPKAEGELAFVLEKDLTLEQHTIADLLPAIAYALPALEIVDSRIKDWKISIYDTVADNASSGLFVLGTNPVSIKRQQLDLCGMVLELKGEPVSLGAGAACLGNPLNALLWLADTMVRQGHPLRAGDVVLSGALGPMIPLPYGETVCLKINGIGALRVSFKPQLS